MIAGLAGLVVVTAGCATSASSPSPSPVPPVTSPVSGGGSTPPASPPAAAPGLLLEVTSEGGFISPIASLSAPPQVVVDDDGRIYTPVVSDAPGVSIVPPIGVRDVGVQGAARILDAIRAAGLDREATGGGVAADTGFTVFTAVVDGRTAVSRFAAGPGPGGPGVVGGPGAAGGDGAQRGDGPQGGAAAFDLLARLTDPGETWGATAVGEAPYVPVGYRVFVAPAASADATVATEAWPLASPLASFGQPFVADLGVAGLRSGRVTGPDATLLAAALATATPDVVFTSGDMAYRLWVQPLFPDAFGS